MITPLAMLTMLAMTPDGTAVFDGRYTDPTGMPQAYSADAEVDGTVTDSEGRTGSYSLAADPTGARVLTLDFGMLGVHTMNEGPENCWEEAQPPVNPDLQELAICLTPKEHHLAHFDPQVCDPDALGPIFHTAAIFPEESGHWMAGRLTPTSSPNGFWVHEVVYLLNTSYSDATYYCAAVDHRVQVFLGPDNAPPPADPVVIHEEQISGASLSDPWAEITVALPDPLLIPPGQSLYVSVEMIDDGVEEVCATMCADGPILPEHNYWSDATQPDYPWYDLVAFPTFYDMMVQAHGIAAN